MHFINHLGNRGADYLHPGGKLSTDFLISEICNHRPNRVLELGCGTGATLIGLASQNIPEIFGVDISASQIAIAQERVQYCSLEGKIHLNLLNQSGILEFGDDSFDVVYAESVLAILADEDLINMMKEVKRVLKPNGIFLSNDAIWKIGVPIELINKINNRTLKGFGLIQSSAKLIGIKDWADFLISFGFKSCKIIEINQLTKNDNPNVSPLERASHNFTQKKRHKSFLNPTQLFREFWYKIKLSLFHKNDGNNLENIIFILKA
jgi:ubiquinone/menaquinone biosynthesis C-methylase UbiE